MVRSMFPGCLLAVTMVATLGGSWTPPAPSPAPGMALGMAPGIAPASPRGSRACKPDCRKKRCGTDGCGGTCGTCPTGKTCHLNRCIKRPKDPCRAMYGTWVGAMYLQETHLLRGKVWGTRHACFGRFHITFPLRGGRGSADETFTITFPGKLVYFRGTRIIRHSPGSLYGLDNFSGTVDFQRGRFVGVFHDNRRKQTAKVLLKKK